MLRDCRVGKNLELHKRWTRLKITLKFEWDLDE